MAAARSRGRPLFSRPRARGRINAA